MTEVAVKIAGPYSKYEDAMQFLRDRLGTHDTAGWRRDVPEVWYDAEESNDDHLTGYFYIADYHVAFEFKMIFG